ncbi:NAD-dependent epimerase/dehydratase family protein [Marimonas arenosa]|uniref:NAD(P)-dependent oxidoreductase n=1 Tax=Marimonas arenosa TaxID=1795305 RepID=A0AAE3WC28_9RHOB|nr:NAD(P)-dependent oxidoreductase [Marimonas arenosa]MDQ2088888.1 NAD(P)-dependent oxidoreductase [Marimonas arenosa]
MKVLMTGASGGIGTLLRPMLHELGVEMRLSDIAEPENGRAEGEDWVIADMCDAEAMHGLVDGCDAILNFGGISTENTAELIHSVNVIGTYNLYDAARKAGVKRILFASSNHAIGFHTRETRLDAEAPVLPDSLYGVSKVYGEGLALYYWKKFGIEGARVRIGSCFEKPKDRRMMATWMSARDMLRLIDRVLKVPRLGCPVVYGVSANDELWWDNSKVAYLGWQPQDSSRQWAGEHPDEPAVEVDDPAIKYQGGGFAKAGHFDD